MIQVHHVGSRGGWSSNPLSQLGSDVFFTLYDADEECVKYDKVHFKSTELKPTNYKFIAAALGSKNEKRQFTVTKCPTGSSFLDFNEDFWWLIQTVDGYNHRMMEALAPQKKMFIECHSFDELFSEDQEGAPDFLSLDAEGFNYDALKGADQLLTSRVLGVLSEVEFIELRKNQKTFHSILEYLTNKDFFFVGLEQSYDFYHYYSIDDVRGKGFIFLGEALFLKKHTAIIESKLSKNDKILLLFKLAAISICFNRLDYAYQILRDTYRLWSDDIAKMSFNMKYQQLCIEYFKQYERLMESKFPKQRYFSSLDEFVQNKTQRPLYIFIKTRGISIKSNYPHIYYALEKVLNILITLRNAFNTIALRIYYEFSRMDEIESILFKYGLVKQAKCQKIRRINYRFKNRHEFLEFLLLHLFGTVHFGD